MAATKTALRKQTLVHSKNVIKVARANFWAEYSHPRYHRDACHILNPINTKWRWDSPVHGSRGSAVIVHNRENRLTRLHTKRRNHGRKIYLPTGPIHFYSWFYRPTEDLNLANQPRIIIMSQKLFSTTLCTSPKEVFRLATTKPYPTTSPKKTTPKALQ